METVTSADGTDIGVEREGTGPLLVLVHGGSATRESWIPLTPHLVDDYTVVTYDRRGRGASGDAEAYALDREVEDLAAVLETVDRDATVFGHSFGGLVALAAAMDGVAMDRLLLYEPALPAVEGEMADFTDRMGAALAEGDRKGAMRIFFVEAAGIPEPERLPIWPDDVNFHLAGTVLRESEAVEAFELPASPAIDVLTLLLMGEDGPENLHTPLRRLDERLPDSRLVELDGVGHVGNATDPERMAAVVREFLAPE